MKYPSKLRPTRRIPAGECPCGALAVVSMWEADLGLCYEHARDWLGSEEKASIMKVPGVFREEAGAILPLGEVVISDEAILRGVNTFVERIWKEREGRLMRLAKAWIEFPLKFLKGFRR